MTEHVGIDFTPDPPALAAVPDFQPWPSVTLPDGTVFVLGCALPSGAQVTFRDPLLLRARDQEQVLRGVGPNGGMIGASLDIANGTIAMLVEGWTLDLPSPRDSVHVLGDLTIEDKRALTQHCGPVVQMLFPDTSVSSDRTSPTGPSSA